MSSFVIAGLACEYAPTPLPYDFSEDKEKRVDRFDESDRGWMMLFLVSSPKLTFFLFSWASLYSLALE